MNPVLVAAAAAALALWLSLRFGRPLVAWIASRRAGPDTTDSEPSALKAAFHFYELREHFASTGQQGRVTLMDDHLACGVFASCDHPAEDLDTVTLRVTGEVTDATD